ncbi:10891_t:CDS:2, partial [Dentiscutata heterogama]
ETIHAIQENPSQLDCDIGFLKDHLDRPQTTLYYLIDRIQLTDILEIWELSGLTNANTNYVVVPDLHILDKFRALHTFMAEIKQHAQKKVKYVSGFGKAKRVLNLAFDMSCEDEFINIIDNFINQKKSNISITNDENIENLYILDSLVVKWRERPPNKRIKSSAENDSHNSTKTSISAINLVDSNLYIRNASKTTIQQMQNLQYLSELTTRTPFHTLNNNSNDQADTLFDSSTKATQGINENTAK